MEALTACSVTCLTIYDMCKSLDKAIIIREIKLLYKSGGKSGDYKYDKFKKAIDIIKKKLITSQTSEVIHTYRSHENFK